ncbi:restriction endonuclease subunit S [Bacteroides thetaiotaomicron]|uniref:restriction endonuclease subunit S n=1 Tax=Bacteroides thetaiotaomicron TaxID=818 RepID=UPI0023307994|nr:restriction endonuclease subunit S [Bacteroides thetaiotaomicron]MDC2068370.1 restriction endonuclease subunit S [Bacteroides thetaiotaomicron]
MNGKQLKNSILQWAIQGKLVPQDPNDEPASVLLDKIRQEKERLIKEKKIKRDKNASIIYRGEDNSYYEKMLATGEVKCIDEDIPFDVPQSWGWERWGNIAQTIQYGYNAPALEHGVIKMVRISDIQENCVLWDNVPYCLIDENDIDTYLLKVNDILFARTGGTVGKSFLVEEVPEKAIYAGYLIRTRYSSLLNPRYMKSFMESQLYWEQLKNGTIATAQPNCNGKTLAKMLLPIPPTKEQERIVEKLTQLSSFLDNYGLCQDRLNVLNEEIKEQLKKSILQEAIQGKLVPQLTEEGTAQDLLEQIKTEKQKLIKEGKLKKSALATSAIFRGDDNKYYEQIGKKCLDITDEIPFVIPETWQWVRVRDVFQLNPKNEAEDEKLVAFIPMEKISAGYKSDFTFDTAKWGTIKKGFTHFANGDVAFAKITPCFQNRKSAIFHDLPNGIGAGTTELKVLRPYGNTIDRWYLLYFLESPYFIDEATFKGTANQQRIVVGYLEDKLFPLPTQKEQQRIVAQIEKLFEQLR